MLMLSCGKSSFDNANFSKHAERLIFSTEEFSDLVANKDPWDFSKSVIKRFNQKGKYISLEQSIAKNQEDSRVNLLFILNENNVF